MRLHQSRMQRQIDLDRRLAQHVRAKQILPLEAGRVYPRCVGGRRRVPPEDCGGPWAFLELRQRYSLLHIADWLAALAECRLEMGYAAFVDDHYDDQPTGLTRVDRSRIKVRRDPTISASGHPSSIASAQASLGSPPKSVST